MARLRICIHVSHKPHRPSQPSPDEVLPSSSTRGGGSTTKSRDGHSGSRTSTSKRTETPSTPLDSDRNDRTDHRSHAEVPGSRQMNHPGPTATKFPRTFKGLPLPKTPSPHRERPYSVERFMRDFDSRERARMGVVVEEKLSSSGGTGRGKVEFGLGPLGFRHAGVGGSSAEQGGS